MQTILKRFILPVIILFTLSASGQIKDTTTIYKNIFTESCNCILLKTKNDKISMAMDSCYNAIITKYDADLKQLGFDPATQAGQTKLSNEVLIKLFKRCPGLSKLIQKETDEENAKKLLFKGELVSQTKLTSGLYEIIMKNSKTAETKKFFAKNPFNESEIKKYEPGYELTVEYEIVKNKTTNTDEYFLKEFGTVMSVGAVKVTSQ